jgi:PKD repeat protein
MKTFKLLSLAVFVVFSFCTISCKKSQSAPTAAFSFSPNPGKAGQSVQFNYTGNGASSYSWTFGDSSPSAIVENPNHTYNAAGTYNVTLTVSNSTGSASTSQTVTITP